MESEEKYTTRELDHYFKDFAATLDRIEIQANKTNGRVNKLEKWQSAIMGGMGVIIVIVFPLLVYVWNSSTVKAEQLTKILKDHDISVVS